MKVNERVCFVCKKGDRPGQRRVTLTYYLGKCAHRECYERWRKRRALGGGR